MDNVTNKTINPETGTIYSRAELKAAFEKVRNTDNWKNPINAVIPQSDAEITRQAVIFFAGCSPKFTTARVDDGYLRVKAVGYYAAVGA